MLMRNDTCSWRYFKPASNRRNCRVLMWITAFRLTAKSVKSGTLAGMRPIGMTNAAWTLDEVTG